MNTVYTSKPWVKFFQNWFTKVYKWVAQGLESFGLKKKKKKSFKLVLAQLVKAFLNWSNWLGIGSIGWLLPIKDQSNPPKILSLFQNLGATNRGSTFPGQRLVKTWKGTTITYSTLNTQQLLDRLNRSLINRGPLL